MNILIVKPPCTFGDGIWKDHIRKEHVARFVSSRDEAEKLLREQPWHTVVVTDTVFDTDVEHIEIHRKLDVKKRLLGEFVNQCRTIFHEATVAVVASSEALREELRQAGHNPVLSHVETCKFLYDLV
ncbi:MAG: hypothetical protein WCJ25_02705 [Candidatus Moraniibacteriota bacterium]